MTKSSSKFLRGAFGVMIFSQHRQTSEERKTEFTVCANPAVNSQEAVFHESIICHQVDFRR